MKKVLIALAVMMMAVTTMTVANTEPATAYEEQCSILPNGDELCVRFGRKFLCIYINGVKQSCELVGEPTNQPGEQDVPCDFRQGGCDRFEVRSNTVSHIASAITAAPPGLRHGDHPPGTIYTSCAFLERGCRMFESPGDQVLANL